MREEKNGEILHDALAFLEDDLIEEVDALRGGVVTTKEMKEEPAIDRKEPTTHRYTSWRKWTVLAAGIGLFILVGGIWGGPNAEMNDMNTRPENQEEIWEDAEQEDKLENKETNDIIDSDEIFHEEKFPNNNMQEESAELEAESEAETEETTEN